MTVSDTKRRLARQRYTNKAQAPASKKFEMNSSFKSSDKSHASRLREHVRKQRMILRDVASLDSKREFISNP